MPAYLNTRQAADLCGVPEQTVREWIAAGRLRARRVGRGFRLQRGDLERLREQGAERAAGAEQAAAPPLPAEVRPARPTATGDASLSYLADLVRDLEAEVDTRSETATLWQARAEQLAGELELARAQLAQLPTEPPPTPPAQTGGHPALYVALTLAAAGGLFILVDFLLGQARLR